MRREIAVEETSYGPAHENVATYLDRLAMVYFIEKRYADAQPLYERSLPIWDATLDPDDPQLAASLDNLAVIPLPRNNSPRPSRSIAARLRSAKKGDVISMNNLALTLEAQDNYAAAEKLYQRAVTIAERIPNLPGKTNVGEAVVLKKTLGNYAIMLRKLKRDAEAVKLEARAK